MYFYVSEIVSLDRNIPRRKLVFFSLFSVVFFPNLKQIEIRGPFNEMTEELL